MHEPTSTTTSPALPGSHYLRKAEVCAELGISERTLNNLVARREFPPGVKVGKWVYWTRKALDGFRERMFHLQENWTPMQPGRGRRTAS